MFISRTKIFYGLVATSLMTSATMAIAQDALDQQLQQELERENAVLNNRNNTNNTNNNVNSGQQMIQQQNVIATPSAPVQPTLNQQTVQGNGNATTSVNSVENSAPILINSGPVLAPQVTATRVESVDEDPSLVGSVTDGFFVTGFLGIPEYESNDIFEISSNIVTGVTGGVQFPSRFTIEGQFAYSNYTIGTCGYCIYRDLDQYSFFLGSRYVFLPNAIRPYAGSWLGFTRRLYTNLNANPSWGTSWYPTSGDIADDLTSNAFDLALGGGVEILISKNIAIGFDFRYFINLSHQNLELAGGQSISPMQQNFNYNPSSDPLKSGFVESLDYWFITFTGRFIF